MDIVLGSIASLIGVGFSLELLLKSFRSKKPYIISWTVAVIMYTVATIALVSGLINGWNYINFGIFYFFGGITNVPAFGIGSAYLIFDENKVNVISGLYVLFVLGAVFSIFTSGIPDFSNIQGIPEGSQLYEISGPRMWAILGNSFGSISLVGIAAYSIYKFRRVDEDLVTTNVLIVVGSFSPALSGVLLALGDSASKTLSLLVGMFLIYLGYRVSQRPKI
ncbi:hypothetical protein OAE18_00130 [Acidimicrobiia bacterium]|jgi:hypothetical protein|nr:hypothetical protein [Acidimicrobiia bacterium]MDA7721164.1 hypothetical protein [Acidimicrobiaceae bacterium]MDA8564389.1 hypothetical protein [bacterium]MDA8812710.1 hypothetical protein [Candidatus Actinomarina sp.]MDA8564395.1 hypothetical protein [bacterium]|tara:strand:+ start:160 stop:822 length:663 start_codon:yes stop_codon:yes gene_type:complete